MFLIIELEECVVAGHVITMLVSMHAVTLRDFWCWWSVSLDYRSATCFNNSCYKRGAKWI